MNKKRLGLSLGILCSTAFACSLLASCGGEAFELTTNEMFIGSYADVDVELVKGDASKLAWKSSDESAIVVKNGKLIAQGADAVDKDVTITVGKGSKKQNILVHVQNNGKPKLFFDNANLELYDENDTVTAVPYIEYDDEKYYYNDLTFVSVSSDTTVLSTDGLTFTGLKAGQTTVSVSTEYKGLTLNREVNATVKAGTTVAFKRAVEVYMTEQAQFNTKKLNPTVYDNRVQIKNADVSYEILSGEDCVSLNGNYVTALKEGTATLKATYKTATTEFTVNVLPNHTQAETFLQTSANATLIDQENGEFAGWKKYIYREFKNPDDPDDYNADGSFTPIKDTSGDSGVFFEGLNGGIGERPSNYNISFVENGYHYIKFDMHIENAYRIGIRMDSTYSHAMLKATENQNWKRIDVGASIPSNGVYYYVFDEDGNLANSFQNGGTYTVYLCVDMVSEELYGTYGSTSIYAITEYKEDQLNPAVLYFGNAEFYMDAPEIVKAVNEQKNNVIPNSRELTLYVSEDPELNSFDLSASVTMNGKEVKKPTLTYEIVSGEDFISVENGKVVAKAKGQAQIKISYTETYPFTKDTSTYNYEKTVYELVDVYVETDDIVVLFDEKTLTVDNDKNKTATVSASVYENGQPVEANVVYEIKSGEEYISLNGNEITFVKEGVAVVKATYEGRTAYLTVKAELAFEYTTLNTNGTLTDVTTGEFAGTQKFTSTVPYSYDANACKRSALYFDGLSLATLCDTTAAMQDHFLMKGYKYVALDIYLTEQVNQFSFEFLNTVLKEKMNANVVRFTVGSSENMSQNGKEFYILNSDGTLCEVLKANNWYTVCLPVELSSQNKYIVGCMTVSCRSGNESADAYVKNAYFSKNAPTVKTYSVPGEKLKVTGNGGTLEIVKDGEFVNTYKWTGVVTTGGTGATSAEANGVSVEGLTKPTSHSFDSTFFEKGYKYLKLEIYLTEPTYELNLRFNATKLHESLVNAGWMGGANNAKTYVGKEIKGNGSVIWVVDEEGNLVSKLETGKWLTIYIPIELTDETKTSAYTVSAIETSSGKENVLPVMYLKNAEFLKELPSELQ